MAYHEIVWIIGRGSAAVNAVIKGGEPMEERVRLNLEFPRSGQTLWVQVPHWMADRSHGGGAEAGSGGAGWRDREAEAISIRDEGLHH